MGQPDDMLDDEDYPAYTMGRAAEIIGCTPEFLRRLGDAKLIDPYRSGGGHRRYSRYQIRLAARAREMCDQGTDMASGVPHHHPRRPTRGSPAAQCRSPEPLTAPDPHQEPPRTYRSVANKEEVIDAQLVPHQIRAPLGLAHVPGEPLGQLVRVGQRALAEPQMRTNLRPVVLDRPPGPLVQTKFRGIELDRLVRGPADLCGAGATFSTHRIGDDGTAEETPPPRPPLSTGLRKIGTGTLAGGGSWGAVNPRRGAAPASCGAPRRRPC